MKHIKWKTMIITCIICLLPMLLGVVLWERLPDTMAIHFDIYNNPDNFASKGFVVFLIPILMLVLQLFCCFVNDINAYKHGDRNKFEKITKWIIPIMTVVLQTTTLLFALDYALDIRKVAVLIVGIIFILTGNYMPKLDYVKNYKIDTEKARKINRFIGFWTFLMGVLFLTSLLFPPIVSVICLILLVPYTIITVIYALVVVKKK